VTAGTAVTQECVEAYLFVRSPLRLLVLRRPPARGSIWVPVSGKVDASDPGLEAALRRELAEETGFDRFVAILDLDWTVSFDGPDGRPWRLHAYAAELDGARTPALSGEHVAYEWLAPDVARSRLHYADNRDAVDRLLARIGAGAGAP